MAAFLYRLGRLAYRRRWFVAPAWLLLLVLTGIGSATLAEDNVESFEIPGTESQQTMDLLEERNPGMAAGGATGRVVFAAPDGEALTDPGNRSAVEAVVAEVAETPGLVSVADPFEAGTVSEDGTIAYAEVTYSDSIISDESQEALFEAAESGRDAGLTVEIGGDVAFEEEAGGGSELIGLAVAAVVLVITFGSFTAAGMPLLNAIIGVGVTLSVITISTRFFDLSQDSTILAMMLGIALAIDYSLFIASRYRHELSIGHDGEEATGRAVGTAGNAVVFAGMTVMIALIGLWVVGIPMLTQMGLAAAFAVAMAVIIALTMLPALFGFAKHRILGGRIPGLKMRDPEAEEETLGLRWVRMVTNHPIRVLVVVLAAVGLLAVPTTRLELGLPDEGSYSEEMTQRRAYDLLAEGFGPGFNGPLTVVVDAADSPDPEGAVAEVLAAVGELDNVVAAAPATPDGTGLNEAGDTGMVIVIPATGPSSADTEDLVHDIRDMSSEFESQAGASVLVTGPTAVIIDFNEKMADALAPYLAVVVGLSFLILILVFRSILVPLKAALGFLVTMAATFGATVAVFQWGWLADVIGLQQTGPIMSMLPIILIGLVFGLAMDYQVFLVTRMHEEHVHGMAATPSIVTGFQHGARVVAAAAIIMISVFGAFILGEDFIKQVGFALAFAVFIDAFVVRMTIVPAVLRLLGERAWWIPRWLDRVLPDVDVEGEKLRRMLDEEAAQPPTERASLP
ncbi:MMPL family transporter [Phytoactinopolyspora halotolerans]|uniref:MMPL family transporter n=1 Tax=Phytoactinopolyspora halotolerans TaxID=1981512 RepID=A0A6L9S8Z0_9ACTN|nr:MMPL family transporter [Phytoactinopolyspora halotolerans]NEE01537.1 MMPL family transporter [Phytoactinopolyspora halotolerans]